MKIFGAISDLPDNFSIRFKGEFLVCRVSLNIKKELLPFCPQVRVVKGQEFFCYFLESNLHRSKISEETIKKIYYFLLKQVMIEVRNCKIMQLQSQTSIIKLSQTNINF
jgi:hypothetical protein